MEQPIATINIAPEHLEVANCYLELQSTIKVAEALDMLPNQVSEILADHTVRRYIDRVFLDVGFNNRYQMRAAMDQVIKQKFQELEESQTGSTKDIAELLALSHKMTMDLLDREIQLEKLRQGTLKTQTNIQINDAGGSESKYAQLLGRLLAPETGTD